MNNANPVNCRHRFRFGVYLAQTINARGLTRFPCGPGVIRPCLKCAKCGHSEPVQRRPTPKGGPVERMGRHPTGNAHG